MAGLRCVLVAIATAGLVTAAAAETVSAKSPPAAGGLAQPLRDGCQRSPLGIGFDTTPEWVFVNRNAAIRKAQGVVRVTHTAKDDSVLEHAWFDFNGNLVPDAPFRYLVAGTAASRTNNFTPPSVGDREEAGRLHFEWESGTLPSFAWPTDGDRASIWGSWIWDCGHWTSSDGARVTGEHSELHPLNAIVVHRSTPFRTVRNETQTDVFISNQGTAAHAVEQCALSHRPATASTYDSGFNACATTPANQVQPLASRYSFFVPAPPRPARATSLRYRIVSQVRGDAGHQHVSFKPAGIAVTVTMPSRTVPTRYGKTFFVSWGGGRASAPARLRITLNSLLIRHADPNPALADRSGPAWNLYLNANGYWKLLNDWAPELAHVRDGQRIVLNRSFTINVPTGAGVRLQLSGRECDEPADVTIFGVHTNRVRPCPANRDEINPNILLLLTNDDVGLILDSYRSAGAALGRHSSVSVATTRGFPTSGPISLGDGKQGAAGYVLSYSVRRG